MSVKHRSIGISIILALGVVSFLSLLNAPSANALAVDTACAKVEIIFARGSGAPLVNSDESRVFLEQLAKRIGSPINTNSYELGTEKYGDSQYPAVDIGVWNGNALGAYVSGGMGNDYGKSVRAGVTELQSYLKQRHNKCKAAGSRYIIGGYSQGAQVIGQALPDIAKEIRDRIVFVGLFGDPKLHLPEGEGLLIPPACRGKDLSQYRRTFVDCKLNSGRLGARKPYLTSDMQAKTGLWCVKDDYVCGTSSNPLASGHGTYKDQGSAIDAAALEAVTKLKIALIQDSSAPPLNYNQAIDSLQHIGHGTNGQNVVFFVDVDNTMKTRMPQIKQFLKTKGREIIAQGGKVGVYSYGGINAYDYVGGPVRIDTQMKPILPLGRYTDNNLDQKIDVMDDYSATIGPVLSLNGFGNPLYGIYHALATQQWQFGATKSIILITNKVGFGPASSYGVTTQSIANYSLIIDPVNIYPVVPEGNQTDYQELADKTSAQTTTYTDDTFEQAVNTAFTKTQERPVPFLKNMEYFAEPGQEITFDASDSYVIDSTITQYEWDFDGDGIFEETTTISTTNHVYTETFNGYMQVRTTAANGLIANMSAGVKIGTYIAPILPSAPVGLTATVVSTTDNKSTMRLDWQPNDNLAVAWSIGMNGVMLGTLTSDRMSIEITDIDRLIDVEFSVAAITENSTLGSQAFTTLEMIQPTPTPTPTPTPQPNPSNTCTSKSIFAKVVCAVIKVVKSILSWLF